MPVNKALIELNNLQGNLILLKSLQNAKSFGVDLTGYPKGMYLIKVFADGKNYENKILKE